MTTEEMRITQGLKPRAIAVLCALRCEPRTERFLSTAIGDGSVGATVDLLRDMRSMKLVVADSRLLWCLLDDGVAWLETNGLHAEKRAQYSVLTAVT